MLELTHAHMLKFGRETFRPQVMRRFGIALLDNVFCVEFLQVLDGLLFYPPNDERQPSHA